MTREASTLRGEIYASMKEAGMHQDELAGLIGIRRETLNRKMNGRPFTEHELIRIKRLFRWYSIGGRDR
jgi:DNA-binding XRE family transcriptional regulator